MAKAPQKTPAIPGRPRTAPRTAEPADPDKVRRAVERMMGSLGGAIQEHLPGGAKAAPVPKAPVANRPYPGARSATSNLPERVPAAPLPAPQRAGPAASAQPTTTAEAGGAPRQPAERFWAPFYDPRVGILPNIQERVLKPIFRPGKTIAQRGGADPEAGAKWNAKQAYRDAGKLFSNEETEEQKRIRESWKAKGWTYEEIMGMKFRDVGRVSPLAQFATGVMNTPLELLQMGGQAVEVGMTRASLLAGMPITSIGETPGRGASAHRSPDSVAQAIANRRAKGKDTEKLEKLLLLMLDDNEALADELITKATILRNMRGRGGMEMWDASQWGYEGLHHALEAIERLQAGESWESVSSDIEDKITFRERMKDLAMQLVLDPLNLFDVPAKGARIATQADNFLLAADDIGDAAKMATLSDDWVKVVKNASAVEDAGRAAEASLGVADAARRAGETLRHAQDWLLSRERYEAVVKASEQAGELMKRFGGHKEGWLGRLETIPVLKQIMARTPLTEVRRLTEEGSTIMRHLFNLVDNPQVVRNLLDAGLSDFEPARLVMEVFLNPVADDVLGTGKSAPEIIKLLGLEPRIIMDAGEAKNLGAAIGTVLDPLASPAALRARAMMSNLEKAPVNLYDKWKKALTTASDALRMPGGEAGIPIAKNVAKRKALDAADEAVAKFMFTLEDAAKIAVGYEEPPDAFRAVKGAFDAVQSFHANFHMGYSPGWAMRNFLNNWATSLIDGVATFTPMHSVDDFLALHGFVMPIREFGAQMPEVTKGKYLLKKFSIYEFNRAVERAHGRRIFAEGIQKTFRQHWKVGGAISDEAVDVFRQALGNDTLAKEVIALVENRGWSKEALRAIPDMLMREEAWRTIADPEILKALDEAGLTESVFKILDEAPGFTEGVERIKGLLDDMESSALETFVKMPAQPGTADAMAQDLAAHILDQEFAGLSPQEAGEVYNEFMYRLGISRFARAKAENYAMERTHIIGDLIREGKLPATSQAYDLPTRLAKLQADMNAQYGRTFQLGDAIRSALFDKDVERARDLIDELIKLYPDNAELVRGMQYFRDYATTVSDGWRASRRIFDLVWEDAFHHVFDEMVALGDEATRIIQGATDMPLRPPPDWAQIERLMPFSDEQGRKFVAELSRVARQAGIDNDLHLTRYLQKQGLLDEGVVIIRGPHIRNQEHFEEMLEAIRTYRPGKPRRIMKAAAEAIPPHAAITQVSQPTLVGARSPLDVGAAKLAQADQGQSAFQRLLSHLLDIGSEPAVQLSGDQLKAINAFLDGLYRPLEETRIVAEKVGMHMRDFTLLNYGDRRNFDTALSFLFNYPYWYFRTMANYVRRMFQYPGRVAALFKFQQALRSVNRDLPEWWRDQIRLDILGETYYLPIMQALNPLANMIGGRFLDPDLQDSTPFGRFLAETAQFGPGTHALLAWLMFADSIRRGDRDEADAWMSYMGQPTRALNAVSVLLGEAGLPIPAGGYGVELWMWDTETGRFKGTKWEQRRVSKTLIEMYQEGLATGEGPTMEQVYEAVYFGSGEWYDRALQRMRVKQSAFVLLSWLCGAGFHARETSEIDIWRMDMAASELFRRSPYASMLANDAMTPEQYRLAWQKMREDYPWMDAVYMSRRDALRRDQSFAWTVFNRMPPNNRPYFEAFGASPSLLDKFYEDGLEKMTTVEREEFMNVMKQLSAILACPADTTVREWNMARNARNAMYTALEMQFGELEGIWALEEAYYNISENEGPEAAREYLEKHPDLEMYWRRKDELVLNDPVLARYWASMDMLERSIRAEFYDEVDALYPNIDAIWDEYHRLKEENPDAAGDYFDAHPELKDYLKRKNEFELALRDRLESMADAISQLEVHWASLREDLPEELSERQLRIQDLVENSSRPIGEFELPEDLPEHEVYAAVKQEIDSIPNGEWGAVRSALRRMGGLDDVFNAILEFGNVATVKANMTEVRALLAGLNAIREAGGWALAQSSDTPIAEGKVPYRSKAARREAEEKVKTAYRSKRSGGTAVRSSTWGGASTQPTSAIQEKQLVFQAETFLAQLREAGATVYWSYLRQMADMTLAQQKAFLEQYPRFARWLDGVLSDRPDIFFQVLMGVFQNKYTQKSSGKKASKISTTKSQFRLYSLQD